MTLNFQKHLVSLFLFKNINFKDVKRLIHLVQIIPNQHFLHFFLTMILKYLSFHLSKFHHNFCSLEITSLDCFQK